MQVIPKSQLVVMFMEIASAAKTPKEKIEAQDFFEKQIMSGDMSTREARHSAFWSAANAVAARDDRRYQIPQTHNEVMARIKAQSGNVHYAVRKVGLNVGAIEAPGWGAK